MQREMKSASAGRLRISFPAYPPADTETSLASTQARMKARSRACQQAGWPAPLYRALAVHTERARESRKDILIVRADGLTGIKDAIEAAFPQTGYQRCIARQVRNTLKYVSDKDRKAFANDLRRIYGAPGEELAHGEPDRAAEKRRLPIRDCGKIYGELSIMYDGRPPD